MRFNNKLDELIIAALHAEKRCQEKSEDRKEMVWESLEFPKRRHKPFLIWMAAAAACLSLLVVSSLLFLKVKSQEVEILATEALIQKSTDVPNIGARIGQPTKNEALAVELVESPDMGIAVAQVFSDKPSKAEVSIQPLEDTQMPELPFPDIEFSVTSVDALVEMPNMAAETLEKERQVSKKPKLKFRFGNPSFSSQSHQALALNIKL